jgi:hypothetical protein
MTKSAPHNAVALKLPDETIADSGKVRLGSAGITTTFPPLKRPDEKIADDGKVRLGSAGITTTFPLR